MSSQEYVGTANELTRRIYALIPGHPEIMAMSSPWGLFKIPEFDCDDIGPSLAQVQAALATAKSLYERG